jgi:hypothetical protein
MDGTHGVSRLNIRDTNDLCCRSSCDGPRARGLFAAFIADGAARAVVGNIAPKKKALVVMYEYFSWLKNFTLLEFWLAPVSVGYRGKDVLYRTRHQIGPKITR